MKKISLLIPALVFAFAVGSAFADSKANTGDYNGITYFSPASTQDTTAAVEPAAKTFNGITSFETVQPRSEERSYAAGGSGGKAASEKKPFNGITAL